MAKIITLRYRGKCRECGEYLPVGSRARWYPDGRIYGLTCHAHVNPIIHSTNVVFKTFLIHDIKRASFLIFVNIVFATIITLIIINRRQTNK